jgi:hypothetical protein
MPRHGALLFKSIWGIQHSRKVMGTEANRSEDMAKYQNFHFNRTRKKNKQNKLTAKNFNSSSAMDGCDRPLLN